MSSFADISIRFSANLKEFSGQLDNAQRDLKRFGSEMKKTGAALSIGLTAPLAILGVKSFSVFSDFEDQLAKVKAISGATGAEFDALRKNAEDLGASTRFTASQVGELELNLSKLGFKPTEILDSTAAILELSIATGEDLANSATVAASTLRGFQLEASEMDRVVDVMAKSFSSSALDLGKFQVAMGVLAPVAKTAGVSIEEATGQLAVLVNAGIDASTAGTGLRNIFLDLADKGLTMDQAFDKINSSTNKNKTAMELFGKRGATVATVLADNADEAKALTKQFNNAAGSAKAMSAIMDNTAKGSMAAISSAMESANIAIGEALAPAIRNLADRAAQLISKFKDLNPQTKQIIVIVGGLAAAIGPVLVGIGFLSTNVIPGLITAFAALKAAILANPLITLAVAIAAVTAALVIYTKTTSEASVVSRTLSDIRAQSVKNTAKERAELDSLMKVAKDETQTKEARLDAIKKLNDISPEYLGNITLETINTNEATTATEKYIASLNKKAATQAALAKKQELFAKRLEKEVEILGETGFVQDLSNKFWEMFGVDTDVIRGVEELNRHINEGVKAGKLNQQQADLMRKTYEPYVAKREKELGLIDAQINALDSYIDSTDQYAASTNSAADAIGNMTAQAGAREKVLGASALNGAAGDGIKAQNEELQKHIDILKIAQSQYPESSAAYKMFADQIAFHSETIRQSMEGMVPEGVTARFDAAAFNFEQKMQRMKEIAEAVGDSVAGAFESFTGRLVDSLGLADDGFQGFVKGLSATVTQLIAQMLAAAMSQSIAGATASGTATGPAAVFATPAFIATAIGGILGAFASIPKFAAGGIVSGPTLGLMGEYAGARNNPEVIAPLNKLKDLLEPTGSGEISIGLGTRLRGGDLEIIIDRAVRRNMRLG